MTHVVAVGETEARARLTGDPAHETRYGCLHCTTSALSRRADTPVLIHECAGLGGVSVPLVEVGVKHKIELVERQDYIRGELVQTDARGRPIMAVVTTRDDGQDCTVLAPCATVDARDPQELTR